MPELVHADGAVTNPDVRYERRDVNSRWVVLFAVALLVVGVLIHLVLWWMFEALLGRESAAKRSELPLLQEQRRETGRRLPPTPRLEGIEAGGQAHTVGRYGPGSGREQAAVEEQRLNEFGWVDPKAGLVRIPVRDAMRIALNNKKQYLPSEHPATPPAGGKR